MSGPADTIQAFINPSGGGGGGLGTATQAAARLAAVVTGIVAFLAGTLAYVRRARP